MNRIDGPRPRWVIATLATVTAAAFISTNIQFSALVETVRNCAPSGAMISSHFWSALLKYALVRAWIEVALLVFSVTPSIALPFKTALREWGCRAINERSTRRSVREWEVAVSVFICPVVWVACRNCSVCPGSNSEHCGVWIVAVSFGISLAIGSAYSWATYRDILPPLAAR